MTTRKVHFVFEYVVSVAEEVRKEELPWLQVVFKVLVEDTFTGGVTHCTGFSCGYKLRFATSLVIGHHFVVCMSGIWSG